MDCFRQHNFEGGVIGNGAVIGANSVVTKSIPDYAIAVGSPCRVIGYRFSEDIIEQLLKIKWWDWDEDKIRENMKYFYKIEDFIEHFQVENDT